MSKTLDMSVIDSTLHLKEIILNTNKPLVLRDFKFNWKCFEPSIELWCRLFDKSSLQPNTFERILQKHWNAPQWERYRSKVYMSCENFLKECAQDQETWIGMNYKRVSEIPTVCKDGLDFSCFGFPHATDDCSLWLCSKGANTPCHFDSYGCNIVVQIYGRKSWLMFPPNTPLTEIRIPYEESSVYCSENFYSPEIHTVPDLLKNKDEAYHCILNPNDVLIVPRQWWHYVESLETSLSVNSWIPLDCDLDSQVEECIVKFIIERFALGETNATQKYLLNPNQLTQITDDDELFVIFEHLINARKVQQVSSKHSIKNYPYQYLDESTVVELVNKFSTASFLERLTNKEFKEILTNNSNRFDEKLIDSEKSPLNFLKEILVNSICNPSVIALIKQKLYQRLKVEATN